jgi:uncharacterized membrane protein
VDAIAAHEAIRPIHPLHAIVLAFPFPLFLGALLSDLAYWASFEVQWLNFSQWLNASGLFVGAFALLWALVNVLRRGRDRRRRVVYLVVLVAMCVVGFVSGLVHAKDAWATMPEGLYLAAVTALLALVASWIGYSGFDAGGVK